MSERAIDLDKMAALDAVPAAVRVWEFMRDAGVAALHGESSLIILSGEPLAAVLPVEAVALWQQRQAGWCPACADGRHRDCVRHHGWQDGDDNGCKCDHRDEHARITGEQVALIRAARRH